MKMTVAEDFVEVKINPPKKVSSYAEILQHKTVKFAFGDISKSIMINGMNSIEVNQLHTEFDCRDFLGDVLFSEFYKIPIDIYRFKHVPTGTSYNGRGIIVFADQEILINNIKNILWPLENKYLLGGSITIHPKGICVFPNIKIASTVFGLSLYSYILKCMAYPDLPYLSENLWMEYMMDQKTNEGYYMKKLGVPKFKACLASLQDIYKTGKILGSVNGYDSSETAKSLQYNHDFSGFVTLGSALIEHNMFSRLIHQKYEENKSMPQL